MKKGEYPKAIADQLGIPAVQGVGGPWMSNQGTVLGDWVKAVSEALDVPYTGKVPTMKAMVQAVGEAWNADTMASERTASRGGGNISLPAFQALLRGLQGQPVAQRRQRLNGGKVPFITPAPDAAQDREVLRAVRIRRGQPQFRAALLVAYAGRCAITDCDATATLEAAHITPYGDGGTYETRNGLLLRADIHTLFDLMLLAIDPGSGALLLHPELRGTTYESELQGATLRRPERPEHHPDTVLLLQHRERCGL